jgi:hypothetical protein
VLTILLIVVLVLALGGFGHTGYRRGWYGGGYGDPGMPVRGGWGGGGLGLVLLIVFLFLLFGRRHYGY